MNETKFANPAEEKLAVDIVAEQGTVSDYAFAKKLGFPRSTWQAVKTRKRHINNALIAAITRVYGDKFDAQILAFHHEGCPNGK